MANTVTLSVFAKLTRDTNPPIQLMQKPSVLVTQSGEGLASGIQNIGTSAENLNIGDVGTVGYAFLENLDDTNYVELGWDSTGFVAAIRIRPLHIAMVELDPARTWQAKANTAAIELHYTILEV